MNFRINAGIWNSVFAVPAIVADNLLKIATGDQLKVLLYMLRHCGESVTDGEIAENTGIAREQVPEAVMFWKQVNVFSDDGGDRVIRTDPAGSEISQAEAPKKEDIPRPVVIKEKRGLLHSSEIARMMKDSPDISELFKMAESILGTLNNTMQNSLIWIHDYLGLKKEVIITLLSYCATIGKANARYIETIACDWSENDINTLSLAQDEVTRMSRSHEFTSLIMKIFEMKRSPTANQKKYISAWQSAGYSTELIRYAYEKTIEQIDKLSFPYINKILLSWGENGYKTLDDVKNAEKEYKEKYKERKKSDKGNDSDDDFDVDKYKMFINNF